MKLSSQPNSTSFYESFSDLIFATMAIFVLLMIIFLTLVTEPSQSESQRELKQAENQRDTAREQLAQMASAVKTLEQAMQAQELELIVAVDVTGSMEEPLGHLVETMLAIGKSMPTVSPRFSLGVVAYRQTPNSRERLAVFNKQQIQKYGVDAGRSFAKLKHYLGSLKAENGIAPVAEAVYASLDMFSKSGFSGQQVFLLLGDVGPYENSFSDFNFDRAETRIEQEIINEVTAWMGTNEKRTLISLFSGQQPSANQGQEHTIKYRNSLRFFQDLAQQANVPDNFTRNPGKMLAYLLTAIVETRE